MLQQILNFLQDVEGPLGQIVAILSEPAIQLFITIVTLLGPIIDIDIF